MSMNPSEAKCVGILCLGNKKCLTTQILFQKNFWCEKIKIASQNPSFFQFVTSNQSAYAQK